MSIVTIFGKFRKIKVVFLLQLAMETPFTTKLYIVRTLAKLEKVCCFLLRYIVKRARIDGPADRFNTYITVKLDDVTKHSTRTVQGNDPVWNQELHL